MRSNPDHPIVRITSGIPELDEILHGGFIAHRAYLVRGGPGSGKTTLGLHFLSAAAPDEAPLFITMSESVERLRQNAELLGFNLEHIHFLDLTPSPQFFVETKTYDIFSPAEVERNPITRKIIQAIETFKPQRVFVDAITQFRYLTGDAYQFRQQVLSFLQFLTQNNSTVLLTSEAGPDLPDEDLQFMVDGIIHLSLTPNGRRLQVTKFRGSSFFAGYHSFKLSSRGMQIFPRLQPSYPAATFSTETISSGVPELDELLHGGIERGTATIISGPSGVGKTTLGLQFMKEAAGRGERSVVYSFEEEIEIMLQRCDRINIPARAMIANRTLSILKIEPLQYMPDEFAQLVRRDVEEHGTRLVMIDSISGYRLAARGHDLTVHLHALVKYLQHMGVAVLLMVELTNITGDFLVTELGLSYLADNIIFMRYLEIDGELRKAIGVLKKRMSHFERTLREIEITRYGVKIGKPLTHLRGILTGTPAWESKGSA